MINLPKETHRKLSKEELNKLLSLISFDELKKDLKGRNGLRTAKPKNGLSAYVWRMVRFHSGIDMTMPVTAYYDLQDYVDQQVGYKSVSVCSIDNENSKLYKKELDGMVDGLCKHFGLNPYKASLRWGRALGMI